MSVFLFTVKYYEVIQLTTWIRVFSYLSYLTPVSSKGEISRGAILDLC